MRNEYDFSRSRKNPYASRLKKPVTIRLDTASVDYFKQIVQSKRIKLMPGR